MPAQPSANVTYKTVSQAAPAANTEQLITVPATTKGWYIYSVFLPLVQGITQTPLPLLQFKDAAGNLWMESTGSTTAQAVSTTTAYSWAPGMLLTGQIGTAAAVHSNAPIPDALICLPGFTIGTVTIGIGANSQYGIMRLMVAEYA